MYQCNYVVVEMQRSGDVTSVLTESFTDRKLAEQKYHTVLSYAAASGLKCHTCVMLEDSGGYLKEEHYFGNQDPRPEGGEE